ncbi:hypothetical protein FOZ62_021977 [Perkinsus olseni]|uniref:Peptidase A1 domain-containing protein n=1 Tax=Perkinsus olseni TaxID=32597 RepID=A0A7J6PZE1_PEROL|nr:hypothetical protein FOZ62_021977 [Perkinsus olseni]
MSLFVFSLSVLNLALARVLTLPFHDEYGHIVLVFDGQPISLLADSGSARFFVVYGEWFERQYGRGSCRRHNMTCYFCPVEAPCDDIEQRDRMTVGYAGGLDVYQYVQHSGVLDLGQSTVNVTFGVVVDYTSKYNVAPTPTLGLSSGRADIPKTFLQQLKDLNVIDTLSYSVHFERFCPYEQGKLVVGGVGSKGQDTIRLPLSMPPELKRRLHVPIASMGIGERPEVEASLSGDGSSKIIRFSLQDRVALFDTGNMGIDLPCTVLSALIEGLEAGVSTLANSRTLRVENIMWWEVDRPMVWVIRPNHVRFLPTIVYSLVREGNETVDIRISPEHYVGTCSYDECMVYLYASNDTELVVGEPFFRAYDAHVDLEGEIISVEPQPPRPAAHLRVGHDPRRLLLPGVWQLC